MNGSTAKARMPDGDARDLAWLVLRAQAGDRAAVEDLLRRTQELLRPYVKAMLRDDDETSDVMQETLIAVYRRLQTLREPRVFTAWARRVATREVFRWARRHRRKQEFADDRPELSGSEDADGSDFAGLRDRLPELLQDVSPASRAVIALHYIEGLSIEETAAVLDISTGTAKSRLAYGLRALRRLIPNENART